MQISEVNQQDLEKCTYVMRLLAETNLNLKGGQVQHCYAAFDWLESLHTEITQQRAKALENKKPATAPKNVKVNNPK